MLLAILSPLLFQDEELTGIVPAVATESLTKIILPLSSTERTLPLGRNAVFEALTFPNCIRPFNVTLPAFVFDSVLPFSPQYEGDEVPIESRANTIKPLSSTVKILPFDLMVGEVVRRFLNRILLKITSPALLFSIELPFSAQ